MFIQRTCVAHIIAIRCVLVRGDSTGVSDGSRILAGFRFGCWSSVSTQISCLHGRDGFLQVHMTELQAKDYRRVRSSIQVGMSTFYRQKVKMDTDNHLLFLA